MSHASALNLSQSLFNHVTHLDQLRATKNFSCNLTQINRYSTVDQRICFGIQQSHSEYQMFTAKIMNFAFAQPCWTILLKRNLAQFKYSKLSIRLDVLLNANDKLFYSCQQTLCEKEERKGRQLLTILPGLFISNSGEDIKIDISGLEKGWKIIGSSLMVRRKKN